MWIHQQCLVHCAELSGIFWCFHPAHSPRLFHSTPFICFAQPSKLIPVTVARSTQQFLELTTRPMLAQEYEQNTSHPTSPLVATSIMQHIQDLPMALHNTLGQCYFPPDTSALVAELNHETLVLASDGSVLNNDATQAWVLYDTSTASSAYRHGPVPGSGQPLTSLCAEIRGFVSGMLALDAILSTTPIPVPGTSRTLCALIDNKALVSCIQKWHHQGQAGTLAPKYDLLQVAQGVMEKYNITVSPEHVKSHQDNTQVYKDLPWQAQLNCDCDQLDGSSQACKQCNDTLHKMYAPPTGHIASQEIAGKFITSHIAAAIKEASYYKELTQYITNQSGW
jgi:hypothetical protein